jgi:uncharacterized protein (PEP-CTERM system associated)
MKVRLLSLHPTPSPAFPARWPLSAALCLGALCGGGPVQAQSGARSNNISATLDALATYAVNSRTGGRGDPDLVTELRPGLRWDGQSGRVVGSLSYELGLVHHRKDYTGERVQNRLNGQASAEVFERWMYVDATASISQQAESALGTQTVAGSTQDNANRIEVGTLSVSPYVRGVLGSAVNYEARLSASATNGRRSITTDSSLMSGTFSVSSAIPGTALGWGLVGSRQTSDYRVGRETEFDRISASLSYAADADLTLALRGGREATNVIDVTRVTNNTWGLGLTWRPSPRTRAQIDADDRYFGRGYRVLLEHRLPSTTFQLTSSRDDSNGSNGYGQGQQTTLYQLYFAQFASIEPDQTQRDVLVRSFLQSQGLDPNSAVPGGVANSAVSVQETHAISVAYAGRRIAASLQANYGTNQVLGVSAAAAGDQNYRQRGYVANASYRLTPTSSLALTGSRLLSRSSATGIGTELKSLSLSFSDQIARRTSLSASARYSVFNSLTDPYRDAALTVSLSQRF